jgi:hypothetical protein
MDLELTLHGTAEMIQIHTDSLATGKLESRNHVTVAGHDDDRVDQLRAGKTLDRD